MKHLTYIPIILFSLALVFSGCDTKNTTSQEKKKDLDARARESFASDTPQKQVNKILGQAQPASPELSGEKHSSEIPSEETKTATSQEEKIVKDSALGKKVYTASCALCHDKGIAGAPLFGAQQEWANRVSKGREKLIKNAINGYQGSKGVMPPKGGNPALSDADVEAAVAYMLEARPGAYIFLGNGDTAMCHHPAYDFADDAIPVGCSWFAELVEKRMPAD